VRGLYHSARSTAAFCDEKSKIYQAAASRYVRVSRGWRLATSAPDSSAAAAEKPLDPGLRRDDSLRAAIMSLRQ